MLLWMEYQTGNFQRIMKLIWIHGQWELWKLFLQLQSKCVLIRKSNQVYFNFKALFSRQMSNYEFDKFGSTLVLKLSFVRFYFQIYRKQRVGPTWWSGGESMYWQVELLLSVSMSMCESWVKGHLCNAMVQGLMLDLMRVTEFRTNRYWLLKTYRKCMNLIFYFLHDND